MVYLEKVRYDLIHAIMKITDVSKLEKMYAFAEENVKKESVQQPPKPPMIDIQHGVSLAEIKASQVTSPLSFAEITAMFEDEPWEQSLEELLASLN